MEVKAGYKQNEVGVIPEDWDVISLGEVFEFKNGLNKAKKYFGQGTPIVNYMDVYKSRGLYAKNLKGRVTLSKQEIKNFEVRKGDVFFTRTSETVEEVGIATVILDEVVDTVFSGFVLRARHKNDRMDNEFEKYCYSTPSVRKEIISKSSYTTRALTNGRHLSNVKIAIPSSKTEQKAIAEALSDADALIEALEQLIAKKRQVKQGAMQELLTGRRRLLGFERKPGYKQTEVGEIPEDWELRYVDSFAQIKTGGRNTQDRVEDGLYPFFVRSQKVELINSYSFDGEAVLTAGDGVGTGKVFHYINGKFDAHQRVYRITDFAENVNGYFFYLYFSNHFYNRIMQMTAKSSVDSVRMEMIAKMQIPLPPTKEEQTAIAELLSDMDAEIAALEGKLSKARQVKQGMMQELLTGKVRLV